MPRVIRHLPHGAAQHGRLVSFLTILIIPLLALGLFATRAQPVAASCAGTTVVADEAALSTAIVAFNAASGPCYFDILLSADITLTDDLPAITNTDTTVEFQFSGSSRIIEANGFAVFHEVNSASPLFIDGVTINGAEPTAISTNNALDLDQVNLFGSGTGVELGGNALAEITDSNFIGSRGYGVLNYGNVTIERTLIGSSGFDGITNFGTLYLVNSTVNGNSENGIYNLDNSAATILNATISDNLRAGLRQEFGVTLGIYNSIVAGNKNGECILLSQGTITIESSLFQDSGQTCGASNGVDDNIVGENALLGPLYYYGGSSLTRPLLSVTGSATETSPAIDSGDNALSSSLTTDQRGPGSPRVVNSVVDMGAFEGAFDIECPPFPIFVSNEFELSFAISCYNLQTSAQIYGIYLNNDIDLNLSTLPIDNPTPGVSLYLNGQNFTIDGQGTLGTRIFQINAESNVVMDDIVLTGGNPNGDGGAIYNLGDLELIRTTVSDNRAVFGGGVFNEGELEVSLGVFDGNSAGEAGAGIMASSGDDTTGGETTVTTTTFSNNSAQSGAGIFGAYSTTLDVTDSTFNNNDATYSGGAIGVENLGQTAVVANSTFSGNSAVALGGGIANSVSAMTVNNSTFVDNAAQQGGGISAGLTFCFTGDMQVMLADGGTKRMADVEAGDELLGYDFATGQQVTVTVQATLSREVDKFLRLNDLEVTAEHPFAVGDDEWVEARDLQIGDRVMSNGGWTTITSIETVEKTADVYNINVSDTHNFYVSDGAQSYLVHNKLMDIELSDVSLNNSIITNSTGGDCFSGGGAFSGSNNLLDDFAAGACSATSTAAVTNLDSTLADNGGPTMTHALLAGSNAINGGNNTLATGPEAVALTFDQRSTGFPRINDTTVDVGAYEYETTTTAGFCPVDPNVGYLLTDVIGTGQGSLTKGYRTRKLVIPNYQDMDSLYGQLAATEAGVMKYVRFLPQGDPKIQIHAPTSPAYRSFAVDWWGTELPNDVQWVKGQFFWGAKGNKSPRAFVLWPTYETDEPYANVFVTFADSSTNHVAWEPGFIPTQTQVIAIPETQAAGADITVKLALVDVNKDTRSVTVTVEAGGVTVGPRVITVPNKKDTLNLETFLLEGVAAGTSEVTITLESPDQTGDSAAMIGAAVNYACEGDPVANDPPVARNDFYTFDRYDGTDGSLFTSNGSGPDELGVPAATITSFGGGSLGGTVTDYAAGASAAFAGGTLTVNADGTWNLSGALLGIGVFTFQYRLTNSAGISDATATLDIYELCLLGDTDAPTC